MRPALQAKMLADSVLELRFYGFVGDDYGYGSRITPQAVADMLDANPGYSSISMRVNSPGGTADDGIAIKNLLASKGVPVVCNVDGLAASAASLMIAGPRSQFTIKMAKDARVMLHEASTMTAGGVSDHQKAINGLSSLNESAAAVYAQRMGKDCSAVRMMMSDETWMTADQAVEMGFADQVTDAAVEPVMRFDPAKLGYRHAPKQMQMLAADAEPDPQDKAEPAEPPELPDPKPETPDGIAEQQLQTFLTAFAASTQLDTGTAIDALLRYSNDIVTAVTRRLQQAAATAAASNQGINAATMKAKTMSEPVKDPANPAADGAGTPDADAEARMQKIEQAQMKAKLEKFETYVADQKAKELAAETKRVSDHVQLLVASGQVKPDMVDDAVFTFSADWARGERIFGAVSPLVGGSRAGVDPHASDAALDPEKATEKDLDAVEIGLMQSQMRAGIKKENAIKYVVKNRAELRSKRAQMGLVH